MNRQLEDMIHRQQAYEYVKKMPLDTIPNSFGKEQGTHPPQNGGTLPRPYPFGSPSSSVAHLPQSGGALSESPLSPYGRLQYAENIIYALNKARQKQRLQKRHNILERIVSILCLGIFSVFFFFMFFVK